MKFFSSCVWSLFSVKVALTTAKYKYINICIDISKFKFIKYVSRNIVELSERRWLFPSVSKINLISWQKLLPYFSLFIFDFCCSWLQIHILCKFNIHIQVLSWLHLCHSVPTRPTFFVLAEDPVRRDEQCLSLNDKRKTQVWFNGSYCRLWVAN